MEQLAIQLLARRTDPQTSHAAAERVPAFKVRHEGLIYGAIFEAGDRGSTAKEIAVVTGLTDVQVNRRLCALGRRGVIERKQIGGRGVLSVNETRGNCCVWVKA